MPRKKILITVTTYPLPSRSHDELVCTAGMLEDGQWIRIYPVPLSFLLDLKGTGKVSQVKYMWIEIDLNKRTDDFRPESHSPANYDFRDIVIHEKIETTNNWEERKQVCLKNVYANMEKLIEDSKAPKHISLAVFKPAGKVKLVWEEVDREWKDEWKDLRKQLDLFASTDKSPEILIPKLPYKFSYEFSDETGKKRKMMIEDWEIGALYWRCLKIAEGNEAVALEKVKQKYEGEFNTKDIHLFLGTTKKFHAMGAPNPFVIIGVFYPKKEIQTKLF